MNCADRLCVRVYLYVCQKQDPPVPKVIHKTLVGVLEALNPFPLPRVTLSLQRGKCSSDFLSM